MTGNIDYSAWIGRASEAVDVVTPRLVASYRAMLAPHLVALEGSAAPLGLHWCLAPDITEASRLGPDGHPAKGGFLPPVPLPRRMWAGSDLRLLGGLAVDDRVHRRSTIAKVEEKRGRSGSLVFVTVRHELVKIGGPIVEEDQIIVYREPAIAGSSPSETPPILPSGPHRREVDVDPVLLFRYSALTFNGHRIHYDFPYATQVEQYPGLVIHGPLQATLLLNFAATVHGRPPARFSYRSTHPATGTQTLTLCAAPDQQGGLALEVRSADGNKTMKASAQW
jgi:3-methylfumaryl-CoA hydratase